MNYTKVNGLNISKLTLGTVQLGMEYGIANKSGKPDMKKAFKILLILQVLMEIPKRCLVTSLLL
jgi:hypothetical protein